MSVVRVVLTDRVEPAVVEPVPVQRSVGGRSSGEFPVLTPVVDEHVRLAVRAVVTHAPQEWPSGVVCRNDREVFPCRLGRWGRRVLLAAGVAEERLDALVAAGDPYVWPLV